MIESMTAEFSALPTELPIYEGYVIPLKTSLNHLQLLLPETFLLSPFSLII